MTAPGPLPPAAAVGIDVVDLRSPRVLAGLPRRRTVDRVLAKREREALSRAGDAPALFWTFWAAKEAAFKAATLLRGAPPVFSHEAFVVEPTADHVRYGDLRLPLTLHVTPDRLVAVVHAAPDDVAVPRVWGAAALEPLHGGFGDAPLSGLRARFSQAEVDPVRGLPSALVRLAVRREAAVVLELDEARLEVVCPPGPAGRRPPYLWIDGTARDDVGLSISHDGGWVAWAVAGSPQRIQGR